MPTALVTGPVDERLSDMSVALKSAGFDVVTAAADACLTRGEVSAVDCYVQLPHEPPARGGDALGCAREFVCQTLLARFDLAAQVAPMLLPRAKVVLVRNRAAPRAPSIDADMLRVLTMAILADHGRDAVRVAVVEDFNSPAEIVRFASSDAPAWSEYADMAPELGFADWRAEITCVQSSHRAWHR
jgi:hypothetical protein